MTPAAFRSVPVGYTHNPAMACLTGLGAQEAGRPDEAIAHFTHALSLAPSMLDVRLLLAFALGAGTQARDAAPHAKRLAQVVLNETPGLSAMPVSELRRLADAAIQLDATAIALRAVRRLTGSAPNDPDLESTLGSLLHRTGGMDEASHVLARAVLRWPKHVPTLINSAHLLLADGHYAGALAHYDRALRVAPTHASARWYRGLLRLMMGDFANGWTDHEARRSLPVHTLGVPAGIPAWDGKRASGQTLLLWGEQGLGDQIQGVRFAANLAALGATVVVRCAAPLCALFATAPGVSAVVADSDTLPHCDAHLPMLSVPFLLKLFNDDSYGAAPYLSAAVGSELSTIRPRTHSSRGLNNTRVGFAWAGSAGHTNDHLRSLPASEIGNMLEGVSAQWVSLQVGARATDLDMVPQPLRATVWDAGPSLQGFLDTAHVLSALDRVVTVDTSVAHLAGALGVPTLLLVPFVPDWRWQLAREDSSWYASIRVLRQPSPGDWASVIARVHRELSAGGQARAA